MDFDYSEPGVKKVSLIRHWEEIFYDFLDEIWRTACTPLSDHQFQVSGLQEIEKLGKFQPKEQAVSSHHNVARLLFISNRVRTVIQASVSFLTMKVTKPNEHVRENWWGHLSTWSRGARQVLISWEITLRHVELKIARLTLICNCGNHSIFWRLIPHLYNCPNHNWTNHHSTPICFIDIKTLLHNYVEFLNTAALGQY
jgi:hypothetical protein